jgi:N-acetylglucosamine-6-phosphate deacetylase
MLFTNARLILPDGVSSNGALRTENGRIDAVSMQPLEPLPGEEIIDLAGKYLAPGFIDLHIHGALHRDAMEADEEAFRTICRYHAAGGTTSLALTTATTTNDRILATLEAVKRYRKKPQSGATVLGVHIEGPYFSKEKPGAHPIELIRHPNPEEYEQWLEYTDDITQMTVAPELPGAPDLIERLEEAGIRASGGHSDAWDDEAAEAFARGMRQVTHTFNCMSTTRRRGVFRAGGLLEFALSEPEILCEVIADGCHVSPTLLRMLYQAKGPDGIALVTDAAAGAGLAEGEHFHIGQIEGKVQGDVALTADGRALCSSTATMIRLVRNMVQIVGAPLHEAVRMATINPACAQRLEGRKGILADSADADLVVLTDDLEVAATYIGGVKFE